MSVTISVKKEAERDTQPYDEAKLRKLIKENLSLDAGEYDSKSDFLYYFTTDVFEVDNIGDYLLDLTTRDQAKAKSFLREYANKLWQSQRAEGSKKEAADEPEVKTTHPQAPATPGSPVEEMARKRIELTKRLETIKERLGQLKTEMEADLEELEAITDKEEPALKGALKALPDWQMTLDGWIVRIKTVAGYSREKAVDILDRLEEITKETDEKTFKLIRQLRGTKKYLTEVAPKEDIEVKRQKSSLVLAAADETLWARFMNWIKGVFQPAIDDLQSNFEEMDDLLAISKVEGEGY